MLSKRIIPCLDVTAGRVVKGVNFVELRDAGDPVEIAKRYDDQGADEITFLDITATSDERDLILHIIEDVASQVFIPLTVGGGVRAVADVRRLLNAGADKVGMNSAAVATLIWYQTLLLSMDRNALWWQLMLNKRRLVYGKYLPMEVARTRASMQLLGRKKCLSVVRAKFC